MLDKNGEIRLIEAGDADEALDLEKAKQVSVALATPQVTQPLPWG